MRLVFARISVSPPVCWPWLDHQSYATRGSRPPQWYLRLITWFCSLSSLPMWYGRSVPLIPVYYVKVRLPYNVVYYLVEPHCRFFHLALPGLSWYHDLRGVIRRQLRPIILTSFSPKTTGAGFKYKLLPCVVSLLYSIRSVAGRGASYFIFTFRQYRLTGQ